MYYMDYTLLTFQGMILRNVIPIDSIDAIPHGPHLSNVTTYHNVTYIPSMALWNVFYWLLVVE